MRRVLVPILAAVLLAGCGGRHDAGVAGPPEKDVRLTSCALSHRLHTGVARGVITNHGGSAAGYVVHIDILDHGGNPVDSALHAETNVGPGDRATFTASGVETYGGPVTCRVALVERTTG